MTTFSELQQRAQKTYAARLRPARPRLDVSVSTCSHAAGVQKTLAALHQEIGARGLDADVSVTSCNGMCFLEPQVSVTKPDGTRVLYGPVRPADVPEFLAGALKGVYQRLAIATLEGEVSGVPRFEDHPFIKGQVRRLMANTGIINPEEIDQYIARGGYQGLVRALSMTDEEIIAETLASGLWGRGGAAFPAGRKWDFLRGARNKPKYMVCNADEGDPGAFVNRILLEGDPLLVIEGMTIAARATGAEYGFLYIRDEYPLAIERCQEAVDQARAHGLLGKNILGSDTTYDMEVVRGAGAYVCGEETGLLSSIQDARGMPRIKPPFPANAGVFGLPTNVNNVETYANAPLIFRHDAAWFKQYGTEKNTGTKMFSMTGDVKRVCAVEIPFGTPLRALLYDWAGGPLEGRDLKAIQPGGPLAGIIPARCIDLVMEPEPFRAEGVLMGGGGIILFDNTTCIVDLVQYFEWFAEDESCGRCTTCNRGTQRFVEILRRIADGNGRSSDIELMELIIDAIKWSNCFHGQGAPTAVANLIKHFRDELMTHIRDKRCPAGVCRGLIRYEVLTDRGHDAGPAAAICPTNAIRQNADGVYFVDQALCIRCDACREVQPDVMTKLHAADELPLYAGRVMEPVAAGD